MQSPARLTLQTLAASQGKRNRAAQEVDREPLIEDCCLRSTMGATKSVCITDFQSCCFCVSLAGALLTTLTRTRKESDDSHRLLMR